MMFSSAQRLRYAAADTAISVQAILVEKTSATAVVSRFGFRQQGSVGSDDFILQM